MERNLLVGNGINIQFGGECPPTLWLDPMKDI